MSSLALDTENSSVYKDRLTLFGILLCVIGALFYCYEYYLRVAPSVMAEQLKSTFSLSQAAFGNLAGFYYYAYTPMQIPAGIAMDRFGPRKVLTLACFFCFLGTLLFSNNSHLGLAQLGRFLVGFGSAFGYVGVLKLASNWLPERYFALTAGICTTLGMVGGVLGLTSMTYLVEKFGWQQTLWGSAFLGFGIALITWTCVQDHCSKTEALKQARIAQALDLKIKQILKYLSGKMIKNPTFWINGLIGAITYLPISVFAELWAVPYLKVLGFDPSTAAQAASVALVGFAVGGPIWGLVSDRMSSRRIPLLLGSMCSCLFLASLLYYQPENPYLVIILLFLSSFFASVEILVFAVSNDITANEYSATAASFTNMLVMLGGALLQPIVGWILDLLTGTDSSHAVTATITEYNTALSLLPLAMFFAGLLSILLPETYKKG
ncbi:MAG: MFS transporter [Gammaproteobacteria bacterium]